MLVMTAWLSEDMWKYYRSWPKERLCTARTTKHLLEQQSIYQIEVMLKAKSCLSDE